MAEKQLKTRFQLKIDTEENWSKATNFIPKKGEPIIYEPDSTNAKYRFKIGDGSTLVNSLDFAYDIDSELSSTSTNPVQNSAVNTALSSKAEKGNFIPVITATYSSSDDSYSYYTATVNEWSDANTVEDLEGRMVYIKLDTTPEKKSIQISFNGFSNIAVIRRISGAKSYSSTFNDKLELETPLLALIGKANINNTYTTSCIALDRGTRAYGASDFSQPVNIDKGGTGATTASDALTNLGAVKKSGDTMDGDLRIDKNYPMIYLYNSANSTNRMALWLSNGAAIVESKESPSGDPSRRLEINNASVESSKDRALILQEIYDGGSGASYRIFHAGMETPIPIVNGGTEASTAAGALTNLGAVKKSGDTMGGALIANATSVATLGTAQIRNIWAGTSDISEVENSLNEGDIYLQYEEG